MATELVEVNNILVDAHSLELRVGDAVKLLAADHPMLGKVTAITPRPGDVELAERTGENVNVCPLVTVRFIDGMEVTLDSDFIRVVVYRWHCNHLERVKLIEAPPGHPQGM